MISLFSDHISFSKTVGEFYCTGYISPVHRDELRSCSRGSWVHASFDNEAECYAENKRDGRERKDTEA